MLKRRYQVSNPYSSMIRQTKKFSSKGYFSLGNLKNSKTLHNIFKAAALKSSKSLIRKNVDRIVNRSVKYILTGNIEQLVFSIRYNPYKTFLLYVGLSTIIDGTNYSSVIHLNSLMENHYDDQYILSQNTHFKNPIEARFFLGKLRSLVNNQYQLEELCKSFFKAPKIVVFFERFFPLVMKPSMFKVMPVFVLPQMVLDMFLKKCALYTDVTEFGFATVDEILGTKSHLVNISSYVNIFMRYARCALKALTGGLGHIDIMGMSIGYGSLPQDVELNPGARSALAEALRVLKERQEYENLITLADKRMLFGFDQLIKKLLYITYKIIFHLTHLGPKSCWFWLHWPMVEILQDVFCFYVLYILFSCVFVLFCDLCKPFLSKGLKEWLVIQINNLYRVVEFLLFFAFVYIIKVIVLTFFETIIVLSNNSMISSQNSLSHKSLSLVNKMKRYFLPRSILVL